MENLTKQRPPLPGSTPTPGLSFNKATHNVYASTSSLHLTNTAINLNQTLDTVLKDNNFMDEGEETLQNNKKISTNDPISLSRSAQEKVISRMIRKLPYEVRESITSMINMTLNSSETFQRELENSNKELYLLRNELIKKVSENNNLYKTCNNYQERIRLLQEDIQNYKNDLDKHHSHASKSRNSMTKLAGTNRMLIDSLEALSNNSKNKNVIDHENNQNIMSKNPAKLNPIPSKSNLERNNTVKTGTTFDNEGEGTEKPTAQSQAQRDKLRESLLQVTREHYRSLKNAELLDSKVTELRELLRNAESQNRRLKSELDEISSFKNKHERFKDLDESNTPNPESVATKAFNPNAPMRVRKFGYTDERFTALVSRNGFDLIDGIQQMRRILSHIATSPSTLKFDEIIRHIVSKDSFKIFGADIIILYILKPGQSDTLLKYTLRSKDPVAFKVSDVKSIATDVIVNNKVVRVNSMSSNSLYNSEVDGSSGVVTRKLLSLPLFNNDNNEIVGAIHIINQGKFSDALSEGDELFSLIFADQSSLLLSSAVLFEKTFKRSVLLESLLHSSTALYSAIPEASSLAVDRPLMSGEILVHLESVSKDVLKCPAVKAFILSEFVGMDSGNLVMLENSNLSSVSKFIRTHATVVAPLHSGIVGYVIDNKAIYQMTDTNFDQYFNPMYDVDPVKNSLIAIPIFDLNCAVVGCLELVVGPFSPELNNTDKKGDRNRILFTQAAQWLAHQISTPLHYLIQNIGKTNINRPSTIPAGVSEHVSVTSANKENFAEGNNENKETAEPLIDEGVVEDEDEKDVVLEENIDLNKVNNLEQIRKECANLKDVLAKEKEKKTNIIEKSHNYQKTIKVLEQQIVANENQEILYKNEIKNLKDNIVSLESKILECNNIINGLHDEILKGKQQEQKLNLIISDLEEKYSDLEESKANEIQLLTVKFTAEVESLEDQIKDNNNAIKKLQKEKQVLQDELDMTKSDILTEKESKINELMGIITQKDDEIDILNNTIKSREQRIIILDKNIVDLNNKIVSINNENEKEKKNYQSKINGLDNEIINLNKKIKELENAHSSLQSVSSSLQSTEQEIINCKRTINELNEKINSLQSENSNNVDTYTTKISELEAELETANVTISEERNQAQSCENDLHEQIQVLTSENDNLSKSSIEQIEKLKKEIKDLQHNNDNTKNSKDLYYNEKIQELETELKVTKESFSKKEEVLNNQLSKLTAESKELATAKVTIDNLKTEVTELKGSMSTTSSVSGAVTLQSAPVTADNAKLVKQIKSLESENKLVYDQLMELRDKKTSLFTINEELQAKLDTLTELIKEKEKVQTILQQQVVKMSQEKMQNISITHAASIEHNNYQPEPEVNISYEAVKVGDWVQNFDADGNMYWYNPTTQESNWELPDDSLNGDSLTLGEGSLETL